MKTPLTAIDAAPALVVIDLQKWVVGLPTVHPVGEVLSRTARLARAFRERRPPVVLVRVVGTRREGGFRVGGSPRGARCADRWPGHLART
ncbi:MAG: isochorismatase family protein, partial [Isosphaeraceae bacterium]